MSRKYPKGRCKFCTRRATTIGFLVGEARTAGLRNDQRFCDIHPDHDVMRDWSAFYYKLPLLRNPPTELEIALLILAKI